MKSLDLLYYLKRRRRGKILNEPEIGRNGEIPITYHPAINSREKEKKQTFFTVGKDLKMKEVKKEEKQKKISSKLDFSFVNFFNIGYDLITPLVIGVFFGLLIDNFLKTKSVFTTVFIFLGVTGTFYNLWKIVKESQGGNRIPP